MSAAPPHGAASPPRLLLITRRFVPLSDPTSFRWLRFVRALVRHGWEVEVLTVVAEPTPDYYDESLLALMPEGVIVHRVDPGPLEKRILRTRRLPSAAGVAGAGAGPPGRGPGWLARELLRRAYDLVTPLVSPDPTIEWVPAAVPAGRRLLRERRFDLVVSASSPFSSHVAARHITRGFAVPWLGDISDPLADSVFVRRPGWRRAIDRRFERGWLKAMDGVVVPVQEMADLFRDRYPGTDPGKIHVVSYGYPEELYETLEPKPMEGFTIVHTGAFYPGPRDPTPTFLALAKVRDLPLKLHHAGGMTREYLDLLAREGVSHLFEYHGFQPRREVVRLQKGAACLLAVGNQGGLQLPGKVLDYMGARRPILMLRNAGHDIAANLVASTRTGLVVDNDPDSIAAGIRRLHGWWRDGSLDSRFDLGASAEYSWARQEERMVGVLERYRGRRDRPA